MLDVVVVSHHEIKQTNRMNKVQSLVYALDGNSGEIIDGFPLSLPHNSNTERDGNIISSSVLASHLFTSSSNRDVYLFLSTLRGFIYVVKVVDKKQRDRINNNNNANNRTS